MYKEIFKERQALGLHRLTGDNSGLYYTNEEEVQVPSADVGSTDKAYSYDIYEISDSRDPHKVKNEVIKSDHPFGDETKILRKTLAMMLKKSGQYDDPDFAEFKQYNEFAESIR